MKWKARMKSAIFLVSILVMLGFYNNCSGGSFKSTFSSSDSASTTQSSDLSLTDVQSLTDLSVSLDTVSSTSFSPGSDLTYRLSLSYRGQRILPPGLQVFAHFVNANNPQGLEFQDQFPLPGPDSSKWTSNTTFQSTLRIPSSAAGTYTLRVGVANSQSRGASQNIRLSAGSGAQETLGPAEIGYRYVVATLNIGTGTGSGTPPPPPTPPLPGSGNTVQAVVDDMTLINSLYPLNENPGAGWYYGPSVTAPRPYCSTWPGWAQGYPDCANLTFRAVMGWGVVFSATDLNRNPVTKINNNTRIQLRNQRAAVLSSGLTWSPVSANALVDFNNHGDFYAQGIGSGNIINNGNKRRETEGYSVKIPEGVSYHFYGDRLGINPGTFVAFYGSIEARKIVDDPSKPDDRAESRYILQVGGDWYRTVDAAPFQPVNPGIGISRTKEVSNEWQTFHVYTIVPTSMSGYEIKTTGGQLPASEIQKIKDGMSSSPPPLN